MQLVYLVFGPNEANHTQAYFSILTFLRQAAALTGITVVTDRPDFYARLAGRVQLLPVDATLLREWEGPHRFFWRLKIKALLGGGPHPGARRQHGPHARARGRAG
jgi:hypothetical protein